MKPSDKTEKEAHNKDQKPIETTPIELLGIMLKATLKDRITDEEVKAICSTYYKTIKEIWG